MQTRFEHFAATSMLGEQEAPPRCNGSLAFAREWERRAFGLALALSKEGHFEWEEFRAELIAAIAAWEATHPLDDPSWDYYGCWVAALEKVMGRAGLLDLGGRHTWSMATHKREVSEEELRSAVQKL